MQKKTNRYGKTRSIISLSIGVIRGNISFSIGLAVMFIITTALCVTIVTNPQTIRNSLEVFEDEYVHPDAWFATGLVPEDTYSSIDVDAVEDVEASVSFDTNAKFNDVLFFLRAISIKDGFRQYYHVEDDFDSAPSGMPKVWMTVYFSKTNGIHAGDIISVQSSGGYIDAYVESLVSMPECMVCCRNVFSWHDSSDFGYILIPDEYLPDFGVMTGMANYWSFKFEKGLTDSERSDTYARLSEKIGDNAIFSELYENSVMKNDIEDELFKIETLCSILPSVTIVIGLMFAFLFINQVMQRQRKTIGMLRALGQSSAQVLAVFIIYILIVSVCSMIIGGGIGIIIVKSTCSVFCDRYSLPRIVTRTDPVKLVFLLFLIIMTGIAACIISAIKNTKVEPSEAYGNNVQIDKSALPRFITSLKISSFSKISVASVYRNRKGILLASVSITSSIILMIMCLSFVNANLASEPAAFGGRYRYDYLVQHSDSKNFIETLSETDGIDRAEQIIFFEHTLSSDTAEENVTMNAIQDDSILIVPQDRKGNKVLPGDGIVLDSTIAKLLNVDVGDTVSVDGVKIQVTALAEEVVNSIQYVSYETAAKLGFTSINYSAIKLCENVDGESVKETLSQVPGFVSMIALEKQHTEMLDVISILNMLTYIVVALAMVLSIIIIYNMIIISVEKRKREYATLNALGIRTSQLVGIVFFENVLRIIPAAVLGISLGYYISKIALWKISTPVTTYPLIHFGATAALSAALAFVLVLAGILFTILRIKLIDPSEVLNRSE